MPNERTKNRRVERTESLLRAALASLIHEKPYDRIVVKEILARANVGRSTFYAHFRDKDELLDSAIREILRAGAPAAAPVSISGYEMILWFSGPIFEHIERHRRGNDSRIAAQRHAIVHDHLQRALVELIASEVRRVGSRRRERGDGVPPTLLAQYVASTFVLVLNWWVETGSPLRAQEVNELFRALILPTLAVVLR